MAQTVGEAAAELLARVRRLRPLVHHLTNFVTANDVANVTLAAGALPVMAHAREEVEEITAAASSLVLNIGTLTPAWVESMVAAGRRANERGIPVVLDPVGAGASRLRTESALRVLDEVDVRAVRGNLGEMAQLAGAGGLVRGVESAGADLPPQDVARRVSEKFRVAAAVTGARDWVADGRRLVAVDNGHVLLTRITGSGCMATALVACFLAVADDPLVATAGALAYFGYAAEQAARQATGPGSFRAVLLDCLAGLEPDDLRAGVRAEEHVRTG